MIKLSIIIPVFNEENTIKELLEKVISVKLPPGFQKEIIVINDGSSDGSGLKIESSKFAKKIKLVSHKKKFGKRSCSKNRH